MGETPHVTIPIVCPQRTDFAIPLLEGGYTVAASISKASSAGFGRFRFNILAEEAFLPQPRLSGIPTLFLLDQFLDNSG